MRRAKVKVYEARYKFDEQGRKRLVKCEHPIDQFDVSASNLDTLRDVARALTAQRVPGRPGTPSVNFGKMLSGDRYEIVAVVRERD